MLAHMRLPAGAVLNSITWVVHDNCDTCGLQLTVLGSFWNGSSRGFVIVGSAETAVAAATGWHVIVDRTVAGHVIDDAADYDLSGHGSPWENNSGGHVGIYMAIVEYQVPGPQ